MVKIIIENLGQKEVEVRELNKTALYHFQTNYIDWMHECGGKGRCTTCKMAVRQGMENLSGITHAEKKYKEEGLLKEGERLACQVRVNGDLTIQVPDESKLRHIQYTQ
ncbi:MAG: (2Fe-2S)-binding protein [Cyclobacteriaceae bacterium]|nr:(2Fe-2S)-binding protein [Cyclobacteriaceae bacterium]